MKKTLSKKAIAVVIIAALLAVITGVTIITKGNPGFLTSSVETLLQPLKSAAASVAGVCEKIYGYMNDYDRLVEENAALRAQVAGADKERREFNELEQENIRLRELLELARKNDDYEFESASIISWSASNWDSSFTISKGSANSDISAGDPIITSSGDVVGVVKTVSDTSSVCVSLIDTTFAVSVNLENIESAASAKGSFTLMKQGLMMVEYIDDSTMVFTGDGVVTSGKGGVFPPGLLVGYVTKVERNEENVDNYATVEPAVDLDNLLYVYIITEFDPTE